MANLDSRFICTSDLDTYYVDASSGLPLSGGIVTFYSDVNRTTLKPVYQLTGTPGNYTYAVLPNPCVLSSSGTFQDALGNNIVPYYYPFTDTPDDNTGVQELYYITCVNSGFVPQFTRQGWPQAAGSVAPPVSDLEVDNYIPNGQFLSHNNWVSLTEPPVTQYSYGSQTVDSQAIAQGGWNFVYTNGTSATFNHSFSQIPSSGGWGINSFPKFVFNFVCTGFNSNAITRDLRIQWPDVNKFSSGNPPGSTPYTLFFDAASNDGNTYTFQLYIIYFFGTTGNGGSPSSPIETPIATISIGPSGTLAPHNITNIMFGDNLGTIGKNNDDYVALSLRGPMSSWNVAVTDFVLAQGNETFTSFPVQTNDQMLSRGVAGWMPTPDPTGLDLYLPLVLTPQGMVFDHSQVGEVVGNFTNPTSINNINYGVNNQIYCDGSTIITSAYSPIGIPFSRLQSVLFNSTYNIPIFGTGANFATAYVTAGATSTIILATNKPGSQTAPADGSTATGFNFAGPSNAGASTYNYAVNANINSSVISAIAAFSNGTNSNNAFADSNTSMTFVNYNEVISGLYYGAYFTAKAASVLANTGMNGKYFTFSDHSTNYFAWFKVSNETAPSPGGTAIPINLISTNTAADVTFTIANVLNGYQTNTITTVAASTPIPDQSWFTFNANNQLYAVWYQVNSSSAAPTVGGSPIYIQVTLTGSENASQVATKTQIAINKYAYAVPNLQGVFLRGTDPNNEWDLDTALRWSASNMITGNIAGTFEFYQFTNHSHPGSYWNLPSVNISGSGGTAAGYSSGSAHANTAVTITPEGGSETRPVNMYVNYYIKY
jgi:hypothetical protein